ncbi:MAG: hypothetical protein DK304_000911 [Chloroflexi bacterium]|jgi:hypothetical protein|nr:MAG: hypothetical protein DK304_000911 [Chloroflexota bacterium]
MSEANTVEATMIHRRVFLKRALIGMAALTAASVVVNGSSSVKGSSSKFEANSSMFSPRRRDLIRYWRNQLGRLRLK